MTYSHTAFLILPNELVFIVSFITLILLSPQSRSPRCGSYICDIDFSNRWSSEGVESLSDAADHCAEYPQQSCKLGQWHWGRGDVFIQCPAWHHMVQILNRAQTRSSQFYEAVLLSHFIILRRDIYFNKTSGSIYSLKPQTYFPYSASVDSCGWECGPLHTKIGGPRVYTC